MGIDYCDYELSKKERRDFIVICYILLFAVAYIFYHSMVLSAAAGFFSIYGVRFYKKYKAKKRLVFLKLQFKDLLYSLSASVSAGHSLTEALKEAYENLTLIYGKNTPMLLELEYMIKGIFENRISEKELLKDFALRSNCEDIRNFTDVYFACRSTGGNVERVIEKATEVLTEKMSVEKEIKAIVSQKKFEGRIISLMPIVIIMFLNLVSPSYLESMYTTSAGRLIMTLGLFGIGCAYYLTEKYTRIEI